MSLAKNKNGKIFFLEEGKTGRKGSGFKHILEGHENDFINKGITSIQIPDLIINATIKG